LPLLLVFFLGVNNIPKEGNAVANDLANFAYFNDLVTVLAVHNSLHPCAFAAHLANLSEMVFKKSSFFLFLELQFL